MRSFSCLLLLAACTTSLETLEEDTTVEALDMEIPADEGSEDDAIDTDVPEQPASSDEGETPDEPVVVEEPDDIYELDVAAAPELSFRGWGLFNIPAGGVWTAYNVRLVDVEGPSTYQISFLADMDSIETGSGRLNDHIRTDDFLDVPNHPTATFTSSSVVSLGGDLYEVTGDMTLRGTTAEISFETTIEPLVGQIHAQAEIEFSRWDFGLYADNIRRPGGDNASDRVVVNYDVWLRLE